MGFWGGMAIGVLICFTIALLLDKPETVINGKNKVKNGGQINNSQGAKGLKKLFKRKNK